MRSRIFRTRYLACLLVPAVLTGCDAAVDPLLPGSATVFSGDQQTGVAGSAVAMPPAVQVFDTRSRPMRGVTVTFEVTGGGGSLTSERAVSGADGIARAGTWTLGPTAGQNTITATVNPSVPPVTFTATGSAGTPVSVTALSGSGQSAMVVTPVAINPAVVVKDAYGNGVANVGVTFAVTAGGGSVAGGNTTTNENGVAHVTSWTLGTAAGVNAMTASVSGLAPAVLLATATAGAANNISLVSSFNATPVAAVVTPAPSVVVKDAFGNPVGGVPVSFAAQSGNGSTAGENQTTNASGTATIGSWTLGKVAGPQTLFASVTGIAPLAIHVNAIAAAPSRTVVSAGDNQSAQTSSLVAVPPAVRITDEYGNPVVGKSVAFAVASGGGSVSGALASTNASGIAAVGSWQLGSSAGTNTLRADVSGLAPVIFTATATAPTTPPGVPPTSPTAFNITVRYIAPVSARQQLAVDRAVARWQQIILADLADVSLNLAAGQCAANAPAINEPVDDILILVDFGTIDGVGNVLGQAGPCVIRSSNQLPVLGALKLDGADLAGMESNGMIDDVVLHEIGHILGIGTLWQSQGLLAFAATDSSTFTGSLGGAAFTATGGASFAGRPVPVENCVGITSCGAGTRDSHWRERIMGRELMTGYISPAGTANPLSRITVQSLADMGYSVDVNAADSYTVSSSVRAGAAAGEVELKEKPRDWPILVH